jgi:hypothetical protein
MHIICGNHDVVFRSTNEVCSLKETLGYYTDCVTIYLEPQNLELLGKKFLMLPWITGDNLNKSIEAIQKSTAPILCGHLELGGFELMKGLMTQTRHEVITPKSLEKYDYVFTGHFHTRSSGGNIHYLGTQFELTWADCEDAKYFHVYDTEKHDFIKVRSPETVYHKLRYDDSKNPEQDLIQREDELRGSYIRVIIENKTDTKRLDAFIDSVALLDPYDLKVVENFQEFSAAEEDMDLDVRDTNELMNRYIDDVSTDLNKDRLKQICAQLYTESQNIEI